MKKSVLAIVIACVCAFAALGIVGCACSSEPAKSSSSSESLVVTSEPSKSASSSSKAAIDTKPVYVLAVGNDSRYQTAEDEKNEIKETDPSFSDTIMLMRLDPQKNYIGILSIPRDTAVEVNGQHAKINDIHYWNGAKGLSEHLGGMLGIEIPYYFDMKFVDFAAFVDKIGGVTATVPQTLTGGDVITDQDITVQGGEPTMNGHEALMVVRQRKVYGEIGEAVRQMITRDLVSKAIQNFAAKPASEAAETAKTLESFGETNMPEDVLTAYIAAYMGNEGDVKFNIGSTPYMGGIDSTGAWTVSVDPGMYQQLREALENDTPITDLVPNPAV